MEYVMSTSVIALQVRYEHLCPLMQYRTVPYEYRKTPQTSDLRILYSCFSYPPSIFAPSAKKMFQ